MVFARVDLIGNLYEGLGATSIMGRDNMCVVQ